MGCAFHDAVVATIAVIVALQTLGRVFVDSLSFNLHLVVLGFCLQIPSRVFSFLQSLILAVVPVQCSVACVMCDL